MYLPFGTLGVPPRLKAEPGFAGFARWPLWSIASATNPLNAKQFAFKP